MNITNHGTWSAYIPDQLPPGYPKSAIFAKSDTTGRDWYDALYGKEPMFAADSFKITATREPDGSWRTQACNVDATKVFPINQLLLELTDYTGSDPQSDLGQMRYDEATNTIAPFPPPELIVPSSATKLGLYRAFKEIGIWDQVWMMINGDPETLMEWNLALEVKVTDSIVQKLIVAMELDDASRDAILIRARELVA